MNRARPMRCGALALATAALVAGAAPPPASALSPGKFVCGAAGWISGIAGKACSVVTHAGTALQAGKKLLTGHVGGAVSTVLGSGGAAARSGASTAIGLAAIGAWVLGGAKFALHETAKVLGESTSPQLGSTWFSAAYWRTAGIAAVLTLPFLFAAAIQALMRSDLALLARAALGYLPLSLLAVSIAAPLTMLLLAASDQMSAIVASAAGNASGRFLGHASRLIGALTILSGSPFLAFLVGLFTASAALVLWLELLMREAAVYVIVLMLPLVFAAFVWPARRVWAIRSVELLLALILSKFAMVAVLSLGGAALSHSITHSITGSLAGVVLLLMGAFAPWALLRLIPLTELASGAAGSLHAETRLRERLLTTDAREEAAEDKLADMTAGMRRQAQEVSSLDAGRNGDGPSAEAERLGELAAVPGGGGLDGGAGPNGAGPAGAGEELGSGVGGGAVGGGGGPDGGDGGTPGAAYGAGGSGGGDAASAPGASDEADSSAAAGASASLPAERLPGFPAMWQAEDGTWRPLTLGIEGYPPEPLWQPDDPAGKSSPNEDPS